MGEKKKFDRNYILVFVSAFLIFSVALIPSLVSTGGVWIYYGDFNVQQIPFYMHVHDAVRAGNLLYDWGTDLGGSLLGCYSFYLLGSPFFWLTIPFDTGAIPYIMPFLSALKYAVMAATAYGYMKRHLKTQAGAFIGALLFSFSGFQGAVLVYNHFHDAIAFFPLYLMTFENLFDNENSGFRGENRKVRIVPFVLMTTFMLVINYYFFVGQVVFLVIYYFCTYKPKAKELLRAFFAGLSGVAISGVYIIPAVYYTLGNSRLSDTLEGYSLVAYKESPMLLNIIKNVVMLPDVSGLNSMLNLAGSRVSGIGGYLPLFSIAGVVAFFLYNKEKRFEKRILVTCMIFAAFPLLNSLFSALNSEYYARWFYMPVLIMAMMTGSVIEENEETFVHLKKGTFVTGIITFSIALMSVLPAKNDEGEWTVLGALKNYEQLISEIIFSIVMLFLLILYVHVLSKKSMLVSKWAVITACFLTACTMIITGTVLVDNDRKVDFQKQALFGESPLTLEDNFYRFETDEDFYNYPLVWEGSHCITSFISTIPDSTLAFYSAMGLSRKVTSNPPVSRLGFRALVSAKYFLTNNMHSVEFIGHIEDMSTLKNYELVNERKGFNIYENRCFVPMGIVFDKYITETEYEESEQNQTAKDRSLIDILVVPDESEANFSGYAEHTSLDESKMQISAFFSKKCGEKAGTACTSFETSTHGFTAETSDLEEPSIIFFSVPYEEGFTASVDGKETPVLRTDYGFMAVAVEEGIHSIRFDYSLSGLKKGCLASVAGIVLLTGLLIARFAFAHSGKRNVPVFEEII